MGLRRIIVCYCYYLLKGPRNDSLGLLALIAAHHRMGLAAPCLSIGKNGAIVAFQHVVDQRKSTLFVDECLGSVRGENIIERKCFGLIFSILFDEVNLVILHVDIDHTDTPSVFFVVVHRSATYHNLYALSHVKEIITTIIKTPLEIKYIPLSSIELYLSTHSTHRLTDPFMLEYL